MRCLLVLLAGFHVLAPVLARDATPAPQMASRLDFERGMVELSNWGRWGTNDQLGALNLVTPAKRRQAVALVRDGTSVSLARDVEKQRAADNGSPFVHSMERTGTNNTGFAASDNFMVSYHGMVHTHVDSLCHMFHGGRMYNGYSQAEVTGSGARKLGVANLKEGILTRGILMDIPVLKGVPYLEPGTAIYPEDLDAWERRAGIRVGPGDVVIVRTGRWARRAAKGPWGDKWAGLHGSCARWLKERDVAVVGSDAASDVLPSGIADVPMPIHQLCIVAMGVWILDSCDLEAVSAAAKERGRWEFLLTVAPLAVPGATGSPVNPIATF
ncbi:MAG: cyclase family protein [Verrucomicrobia bacterium]|nr:MAG: cyclase family protein [Verrucomicrobiota bacterium]